MILPVLTRICMAAALVITGPTAIADNKNNHYLERQFNNRLLVIAPGDGEPASTGSYSLRVYERNRDMYITGLIQARDGKLSDSWFSDLDSDGNPEIIVWISNVGSGSYGTLDIYSMKSGRLEKIIIEAPDGSMMHGYQGHDNYQLHNNTINRKFPRYLHGDAQASPSGGMASMTLDFSQRRWRQN